MTQHRIRKRFWIPGLTLAVLMLAGLFTFPAMAAFACPGCFGLTQVTQRVFIEKSATREQVRDLLDAIQTAKERVDSFYGTARRDPVFLVCITDDCDRRLGGHGAKARAFGDRFIHVSPAGRDSVFLAHELTHIETHARIGSWALLRGRLPAWFDEGLAVIVSGDDRAARQNGPDGSDCPQPQTPLPSAMRDWGREAGAKDRPIYRLAACQVLAWMDAHPKDGAVLNLLNDIRAGRPVQF